MTLTSGGITAWHRWSGIENIWNSVVKPTTWNLPSASRCPARISVIGVHAADHRHVVADRAARAVEQRPEALARLFDLLEVFEAEAELFELTRRDAGQRIAGAGRQLRGHAERGQDPERGGAGKNGVGPHFTTSVARIAVWPAPQGREHSMTNRPAVSAVYFTTVSPRRRLGICDVDLGADDAKAVIGVVAGEVELDHRAFFDGDFRGVKAKRSAETRMTFGAWDLGT